MIGADVIKLFLVKIIKLLSKLDSFTTVNFSFTFSEMVQLTKNYPGKVLSNWPMAEATNSERRTNRGEKPKKVIISVESQNS
jgi:hypothetical protein